MSEPRRTDATLVWFESDLRTLDHPALTSAALRSGPIVPVFVWDGGAGWAEGTASRWWLRRSLEALAESLRSHGLDLVVRRGDPARELLSVAAETGARTIGWNARPEPGRAARDRAVAVSLESAGIEVLVESTGLDHDPDRLRTTAGEPYRVFTAFHRRLSETGEPTLLPVPAFTEGHRLEAGPRSADPGDLGLPDDRECPGFSSCWEPGEDGAGDRLQRFIADGLPAYPERRDLPAVRGTSGLSPHLHFGEITPARIRHAMLAARGLTPYVSAYLRQLAWREFAYHLLTNFPETPSRPLRPEFAAFPWRDDPDGLERWKRGETGYPVVDAGMRELLHTGWMHNRVRMVTASFLTKHLLIPWTEGAAWFRERLVDADLANNTLGWQWTAGCGADAQPFFRIFNPMMQGRRFDPDGEYVRRWIPELESLPPRTVHVPWTARGTGQGPVRYPGPLVDHHEARGRALAAWTSLRGH